MFDLEIQLLGNRLRAPGAQAENPLFTERNRDDWAPVNQLREFVPMRPDVVLLLSVIPVHQQPIQPPVNGLLRPIQQWFQQRRNGQRFADLAAKLIVNSVSLLPARD